MWFKNRVNRKQLIASGKLDSASTARLPSAAMAGFGSSDGDGRSYAGLHNPVLVDSQAAVGNHDGGGRGRGLYERRPRHAWASSPSAAGPTSPGVIRSGCGAAVPQAGPSSRNDRDRGQHCPTLTGDRLVALPPPWLLQHRSSGYTAATDGNAKEDLSQRGQLQLEAPMLHQGTSRSCPDMLRPELSTLQLPPLQHPPLQRGAIADPYGDWFGQLMEELAEMWQGAAQQVGPAPDLHKQIMKQQLPPQYSAPQLQQQYSALQQQLQQQDDALQLQLQQKYSAPKLSGRSGDGEQAIASDPPRLLSPFEVRPPPHSNADLPQHVPEPYEAAMGALLALLQEPSKDNQQLGRCSGGPGGGLQMPTSSTVCPSPGTHPLSASSDMADEGTAAVHNRQFPEDLPSQQQGLLVIPSLQVSRAASSAQQTRPTGGSPNARPHDMATRTQLS